MSTTPRRDNGDTPFGAWIRSQPSLDSKSGYDVEDIDRVHEKLYCLNQYILGYLMLIEEKQYNKAPTAAQLDTIGILSQGLKKGFSDPDFKVKRRFAGRTEKYTYFGYFLIQFEKKSPTDGSIRINHKSATEQELLRLLQFDKETVSHFGSIKPLEVPLEQYIPPKPKRHSHKNAYAGIPTLFNNYPLQQQALWSAEKEQQA